MVVTMTERYLTGPDAGETTEVGDRTIPTTRSFDAFCRSESDRLARALALALNNPELGRDAAAEALARAWERWSKVGEYDNPAGWTYRVGLNWGRSRLRRRRRETSAVFAPEPSITDAEYDDSIATALRHLSTDHRAVIVGRFYLDWSEADLAAALDIPTGTAKSRLSRALEQLEHHLGNDLEHQGDDHA
jgi:RNA polymerase sigma-70 factor (ECF subfamily)